MNYVTNVDDEVPSANAILVAASRDLLAGAIAVLDLLESEGRDTGMGGPISDLRDAVTKAANLEASNAT